jgi:hypothetical protein
MTRWNERRCGDPGNRAAGGGNQAINGCRQSGADASQIVQGAHTCDCDMKCSDPTFHVGLAKTADRVLRAGTEPHCCEYNYVVDSAIIVEINRQ